MRKRKFVRAAILSLATLGMCLPQAAMAVGPDVKPLVSDVALADGGLLQGKVVNPQTGVGAANLPVTLRMQDQIVATTTTDVAGRFAVQRLRGGVHQIIAGENQAIYRFWSPGTAPPSAQATAVVYMQPATAARPNVPITYTDGGGDGGGFKMFFANPIVIGAVVATAIAVPIALNNAHHASP
jgi:hypothetical protein